MNEAETRAEHIDPALKAAGWGVVEGSRILREHGITQGRLLGGGKRAKAEIADYVLVYRNTKLATVEAKAWDKPYTEGVGQAKSYAAKLAVRFAYATNGQQIYGIDMVMGLEADVAQYPSPEELWHLTFAEADAATAVWRDRFAAVPFEEKGGSWTIRYYQEIAVDRVLKRVAAGHDRILLTLATGTGKTSIAFQIAWKLFKSRWTLAQDGALQPRVLFLADRNNLAGQAFNDFNGFAAFDERALVRIKPDEITKMGKVPKNGAVFFTIFQTFMSGPGGAPYFGEYPPDFFDIVIIDECHRGGANDEGSWRGILDYFAPAVQLGLTATPKRRDNADTYAYFGEPVFVYSLKEGINDGFLTPFKVKQIATTLDEYVYTPDDAVIEGDIEAGKRYEEKDFNKIIEIKEREAYRVKLLMGMIDPREKTIVFCATQVHALAVRDLINQSVAKLAHSKDPMYCVRVTANDGARGEQSLRDFQDNEKTIPTILTTSQKLSTGVDARNVRNIVLMRPVNSMIEFKQIIGRGTRLYDGKDYFTIYDFVRAHHHFSDPEWDGEPLEQEVCKKCGNTPCTCSKTPPQPCTVCGNQPCTCTVTKDPCLKCGNTPCSCNKKVTIKLADGKARMIQSMTATTFWSADGRPMSAAQFLESLYGVLPEFFKDEAELRTLWSAPDTRRALLMGLADKGFSKAPLNEMQKIIDAENSDLFDVLAYVAFAFAPETRAQRATQARSETHQHVNDRQQVFLDFVLAQYVTQGVEELDTEKLTPLLRLKYNNAISDAVADLGGTAQIRSMFAGFQKYLYTSRPA